MSNGGEKDSKSSDFGDTKVSLVEDALRRIEAYIRDAELDSPRFQAFADFADLQNCFASGKIGGTYSRDLIIETIRQRKNGVKGYKKEYKEVSDILSGGQQALIAKGGDSITANIELSRFARRLDDLKDREIDKKAASSKFDHKMGLGQQAIPPSKQIS